MNATRNSPSFPSISPVAPGDFSPLSESYFTRRADTIPPQVVRKSAKCARRARLSRRLRMRVHAFLTWSALWSGEGTRRYTACALMLSWIISTSPRGIRAIFFSLF